MPAAGGNYAFTAQVDASSETADDETKFPGDLTQFFDVSENASNRPLWNIGGDLYLFLVDGVGGFTWQIFVYKSTDGGATWTDVTPGSPQKFEEHASVTLGLQYVNIGAVIYIPQVFRDGSSNQFIRVYRFDTGSLAWLADSPDIQIGVSADSYIPLQVAARANGEIVLISSNFAGAPFVDDSLLVVYNSVTNSFTAANLLGLDVADISASGVDSVGRLHFFCGTWPTQARDTSGTFTAQHYVVNADNSITGPDDIAIVTPFVVPSHDSGNAAWVSIGQPVFYTEDSTPMMAIPIRTNSTTIGLYAAAESTMPTWTLAATITADPGQVFETSSACFMFPMALLPVDFNGQLRLYAFWVSQAGDLWDNPGQSALFHAFLLDGTLSTPLADYSQSAQLMPGSPYPVEISSDASTFVLGVFFPVFDGVDFLGGPDDLAENLLTITLTAETATADCSITIGSPGQRRTVGGGGSNVVSGAGHGAGAEECSPFVNLMAGAMLLEKFDQDECLPVEILAAVGWGNR